MLNCSSQSTLIPYFLNSKESEFTVGQLISSDTERDFLLLPCTDLCFEYVSISLHRVLRKAVLLYGRLRRRYVSPHVTRVDALSHPILGRVPGMPARGFRNKPCLYIYFTDLAFNLTKQRAQNGSALLTLRHPRTGLVQSVSNLKDSA